MTSYILRRCSMLIPLVILISVISFVVIQLPPGNFVDTYIQNLQSQGYQTNEEEIQTLKARYGLDKPMYIQYLMWMKNIIFEGDFGRSFNYDREVGVLILERLPMTALITLLAIITTWVMAVPIGIYSAVRQYSIVDYIATFFGFIGLALPNFLFALVLMYFVYIKTGWAVLGIFSPEYVNAPWSLAKIVDMLKNIWLPIVVLATAGTAGLIRTLRATLLDEIKKQYVVTARAKGMKEWKLIFKYPVRVAMNPLISTIGWMLPAFVGGEIIVAQVLDLKTVGPILLNAIQSEDMYLAGGIILVTSTLTIIGTLISDILLAWSDPRIRYN